MLKFIHGVFPQPFSQMTKASSRYAQKEVYLLLGCTVGSSDQRLVYEAGYIPQFIPHL